MKTLLLCLLLGLSAAAAIADEEAPPPAPGLHVKQIAGARIVEAVLPGRAVGVPAAGAHGVAVLVAIGGDDGPRSLYRFDPAGDGSLVELAYGMSPEAGAVDLLETEGGTQVIVGEPGLLHALGALAEPATGRVPRLLLAAADLDLGRLRGQGLIAADRLFVPSLRRGRLEVYRWDDRGELTPADDVPAIELPVRARRVATGLELSIPPLALLERPGQPPLVAVGPEAQGKRRLLSTLVDPAEPQAAATEAWASFSADEKVARSWYLSVDGRPTLVVAALAADKLGIFAKQRLRVFPLRADRTRAGSPPVLEIETATRNWFELGVYVADLDLDGRDDLVLVQPDGLAAKKLAVEVYRGQGNGGFYLTPRRTVIVAPEARWAFGDLDGDRVGDLVTAAENRLQVFSGLAKSKRQAIDKAPWRSFGIADLGFDSDVHILIRVGEDGRHGDDPTDFASAPRIVDFDGDGRGEILLAGERGGRTLLWVVALP